MPSPARDRARSRATDPRSPRGTRAEWIRSPHPPAPTPIHSSSRAAARSRLPGPPTNAAATSVEAAGGVVVADGATVVVVVVVVGRDIGWHRRDRGGHGCRGGAEQRRRRCERVRRRRRVGRTRCDHDRPRDRRQDVVALVASPPSVNHPSVLSASDAATRAMKQTGRGFRVGIFSAEVGPAAALAAAEAGGAELAALRERPLAAPTVVLGAGRATGWFRHGRARRAVQ